MDPGMALLIFFVIAHVEVAVAVILLKRWGIKKVLQKVVESIKLDEDFLYDLIADFADRHAGEITAAIGGYLKSQFLSAVKQDKAYSGKLAEWVLKGSHPLVAAFLEQVPEARSYIRKHPEFVMWLLPKLAGILGNMAGGIAADHAIGEDFQKTIYSPGV